MVQPWVLHCVPLCLIHFYAIMNKDGEISSLDWCPEEFKLVSYRRYVDHMFVLFRKEEHLKLFLNYFNSYHENIKFTSEKYTNNMLSFLDIEIS